MKQITITDLGAVAELILSTKLFSGADEKKLLTALENGSFSCVSYDAAHYRLFLIGEETGFDDNLENMVADSFFDLTDLIFNVIVACGGLPDLVAPAAVPNLGDNAAGDHLHLSRQRHLGAGVSISAHRGHVYPVKNQLLYHRSSVTSGFAASTARRS